MKKLSDVLPYEFLKGGYENTQAYRHKDRLVIREIDGTIEPWPGKEKNVFNWYIVEGGRAIGWNENSSRGWSFPVVKI